MEIRISEQEIRKKFETFPMIEGVLVIGDSDWGHCFGFDIRIYYIVPISASVKHLCPAILLMGKDSFIKGGLRDLKKDLA